MATEKGFIRSRHPEEESLRVEEKLYEEGKGLIRALDILQGAERDIIDFDLTTGPTASERHLMSIVRDVPSKEVYQATIIAFDELMDNAAQVNPQTEEEKHDLEFLIARSGAYKIYIRRLLGEEIDPIEYIEKANSVESERVSEGFLQSFSDRVFDEAREIGISKLTQKAVFEWRMENEIDQRTAKVRMQRGVESALSKVGLFIGDQFNFYFDIIPANEDAYYYAWAHTNRTSGNFEILQNFSKRRRKVWTRGKAQELSWHEGGAHLGRMAKRKSLVSTGELHEYFGLTSVIGGEPIVDEGIGLTIPYYVPNPNLSREGKFQVDSSILRHMVYSNVHLMANSPEVYKVREAVDYVQDFLPWESKEDILKQIEDRTENPLLQAYLYTYGLGAWRHLEYAEKLTPAGKRLFLQAIYARPYTPQQEQQFVEKLLEDPENSQETFSVRPNGIGNTNLMSLGSP